MMKAKDEEVLEKEEEQVKEDNFSTLERISVDFESQGVTKEELISLKNTYGQIYASRILPGDNEQMFIFRKIKRSEYKAVMETGASNSEYNLQDSVVRKCLIFPNPTQVFISTSDAGIIPTVFTQIMFQSGFIHEQAALSQIIEIY